MRMRTSNADIVNKRMLSWREAQDYTGLGRNSCRAYCDKIGATKKIFGRVLFDKTVIDKDLDAEEDTN